MRFESHSPEETFSFGERIGREARPGSVYCLSGELGVGKTVFAKGFSRGLGVTETVSSPSFPILKSYEGRLRIYHFDVYRIGDPSEMEEIGYEDCFYGGEGVSLVEWPERIRELLPEDAVLVRIEKDLQKGLDYRLITVGGREEC